MSKCLTLPTLRIATSSIRRGRSRGYRSSRVRWWRSAASNPRSTLEKPNPQCRHSHYARKNLALNLAHHITHNSQCQVWIMRAYRIQTRLPTSLSAQACSRLRSRTAWPSTASRRWTICLRIRTRTNQNSQVNSIRVQYTYRMRILSPCSPSNSKVNTKVNPSRCCLTTLSLPRSR